MYIHSHIRTHTHTPTHSALTVMGEVRQDLCTDRPVADKWDISRLRDQKHWEEGDDQGCWPLGSLRSGSRGQIHCSQLPVEPGEGEEHPQVAWLGCPGPSPGHSPAASPSISYTPSPQGLPDPVFPEDGPALSLSPVCFSLNALCLQQQPPLPVPGWTASRRG